MAKDSVKIMAKDAQTLSKQTGKLVEPLYTEEDVNEAYSHMEEYDFGVKYKLNDNVSFKFENSGHIISSAQLEL